MFKFLKEHSGSLIFSIILHGAIVAALITGFFKFTSSPTPKPAPELAIQATVVDEKQVLAEMQRQEREKRAEERQARERADQLRRQQAEETQRLEDIRRQREQEEENERLRAEQRQQQEAERRREAEREARRKAEAEAKAEAERKRKAEADRRRKAEEDRRKAAEAKQRAEQEAELKRRMAEEERRRSAVESGLLAQYVAQIQARIQRAWIRPPNAKEGLKCIVNVTQAPGGTVLSVSVGECNGDEVVRRSIEAAVHRASPLPQPADPTLFERNLRLEFKPDDQNR